MRKPQFFQAFDNIPEAVGDCNNVRRVFQKEFGVLDEDVIELHNKRSNACDKEYNKLKESLAKSNKNTLIIHIFAGHGFDAH